MNVTFSCKQLNIFRCSVGSVPNFLKAAENKISVRNCKSRPGFLTFMSLRRLEK